MNYLQHLQSILQQALQMNASDIHLSPAYFPTVRVSGRLVPLQDMTVLSNDVTKGMADAILNDRHKKELDEKLDVDFTYAMTDELRFRVNIYYTKGNIGIVLHVVPQHIKTIEELKLPESVNMFSTLSHGFVLVVGPTGQGKSTTLAAILQKINQERNEKMVTIEDPIEYIFSAEQSIIDQREINTDTTDFGRAIRAALRENVNVMMIGEMRDLETMRAALTAAETGHLVFSTLHTHSAIQTVDRIINAYPSEQQNQVRAQLADTLAGVISQRLVPGAQGGQVPAAEVMIANSAIRNIIRSDELTQVNMVIETGAKEGMQSFNQSLTKLISSGAITEEQAMFYTNNQKGLKTLLGK